MGSYSRSKTTPGLLRLLVIISCIYVTTALKPQLRTTTDAAEDDVSNDVMDAEEYDVVGRYARYNEILQWQTRVSERYPHVAQLIDIGETYERRPLRVLKLGEIGSTAEDGNKWSVWLDGGIHAREHITPATVIYIADQLLQSYETADGRGNWMLANMDWYLLPVVNPDGYEYSMTTDRAWRKNRRPIPGTNCTGVDLNRNWGVAWAGADSSPNPCSGQYRGREAESEAEVRNIVGFLTSRAARFVAFITYHSYGERILTRWDYSKRILPHDHDDLLYVANKMSLAMQQPFNTFYETGTAAEVGGYIFGGGSADWARAVVGIQYTYLIELRDAGARGFQLPVDEIVPTGIENWAGLRELAAHVLLNHGWRRRPTATAVSASLLPASASTHDRRRTLCWTSASDRCRCRRPLLIIAAILLCVFLQHPQRSRRPET